MSDDPDKAALDAGDKDKPGSEPIETVLPRPVQEHLAQQLRATYHAMAEKPAFLGDPTVPPEFEGHIRRLDRRTTIRKQGIEAVKAALDGIADDVARAAPAKTKRDAP